jgi:hypothetical protein
MTRPTRAYTFVMTTRIDPDGTRLPIKLDTTSNGEFVPVPLSPANRDFISRERVAYLENPQPHFRTYGPKTRREFLNFLRLSGGPWA